MKHYAHQWALDHSVPRNYTSSILLNIIEEVLIVWWESFLHSCKIIRPHSTTVLYRKHGFEFFYILYFGAIQLYYQHYLYANSILISVSENQFLLYVSTYSFTACNLSSTKCGYFSLSSQDVLICLNVISLNIIRAFLIKLLQIFLYVLYLLDKNIRLSPFHYCIPTYTSQVIKILKKLPHSKILEGFLAICDFRIHN